MRASKKRVTYYIHKGVKQRGSYNRRQYKASATTFDFQRCFA